MTKTEGGPEVASAELATHERRGRRRLLVVTWAPILGATLVAAFIAQQIQDDQQKLRTLQRNIVTKEQLLEEKGQTLALRDKQIAEITDDLEELEERFTTLQSTVDGLEERQRKLNVAIDSTDPEVIVAKVREQLGGRTHEEVADSLWRRGQDAFAAGQLSLAESLYAAAAKEDATFAAPWNGMGRVAAERKEFKTAEKYYQKAVAADPDRAPAYFNLANLNLMRKDFAQARAYAEKALAIDPKYSEARSLLKKLDPEK